MDIMYQIREVQYKGLVRTQYTCPCGSVFLDSSFKKHQQCLKHLLYELDLEEQCLNHYLQLYNSYNFNCSLIESRIQEIRLKADNTIRTLMSKYGHKENIQKREALFIEYISQYNKQLKQIRGQIPTPTKECSICFQDQSRFEKCNRCKNDVCVSCFNLMYCHSLQDGTPLKCPYCRTPF